MVRLSTRKYSSSIPNENDIATSKQADTAKPVSAAGHAQEAINAATLSRVPARAAINATSGSAPSWS
jgi:hypothetical protein